MRQAACLIPLFSIRSHSGWGLGEIPDLVPFARWASSAGFSVVQVLPVHEASRGQSSPYAALSAFALDPVYVAVDALEDFAAIGGRDALDAREQDEVEALRTVPAVPWPRVRALKARALSLAFQDILHREWKARSAESSSCSAGESASRPPAAWKSGSASTPA